MKALLFKLTKMREASSRHHSSSGRKALSSTLFLMNDWKQRLGVVYSTAADYAYDTAGVEESETPAPARQRLRVRIEKKGRGGKTVTLVAGFVGTGADLEMLGRTLKSKCGVGGSVKDGEVIVQGDFRERIVTLLRAMGYTDTK